MMWRNVWAVVRREYLQRVRSRWFILATVMGPMFTAALFIVPAYLAEGSDAGSNDLAVVDGTGVLFERVAPRLEEAGFIVFEQRWHADVMTELRASAGEGVIGGFLMLDELTLESGEAMYYATERPGTLRQFSMRSAIARSALEYQLELNGVDADAMLEGGELEVALISDAGVGADMDDPQFVVAYIGAFFLYMVILLYAVSVMRATLEEKTNRIVEVIISSMKPWHLMLGKILGVGAVSMTQMAIWLVAGVLLFAMGLPMLVAAQPDLANLSNLREILPDATMLALFVGYFVFGFFMFAGLYAAVGAMCNSDEEAQQAQLPVMMFLIVPIVMITGVIEDPNSAMAVGLSLFPLFSPILMWGRIAGGGVPAWEIGLSFVLMFLAIFAIAWVAGRIYRVGILMSGKRPTLPELWRWIREA
jgi:ABC-2 type transport system permease protein